MPTLGYYAPDPSRWYSPYLRAPVSTVSPPTTTTPGRPIIGTHSDGGCGCGGGCGGTSIVPASPLGSNAPSLSSASTGSGVKVPNLSTGGNMFANIDIARDWWKFLAGAVAYRLLSK